MESVRWPKSGPRQVAIYRQRGEAQRRVRHPAGILPMVEGPRQRGLQRVYVPARAAAEATLVGGLEVYAVENLAAMLDHLNGASKLSRYELPPRPAEEDNVYPVDRTTSRGRSTSSGRWRCALPVVIMFWGYGQPSNWRFALRIELGCAAANSDWPALA